jgi:YbbR domain-containing protein
VQRLRQNLFFKLLSLACAFGLFLYVRKAETTESPELSVDLVYLKDEGMEIVEPTAPRTVRVMLKGPGDVVRGIHPSQVTAHVDVRGKRLLSAQLVPVEVDLPPDLRKANFQMDYSPRKVKVRLDQRVTRVMQVTPRVDAPPPPGQAVGVPSVEPAAVTVSGLSEVIDRIKQLRALVTEINTSGVVDVLARVSAVDETGTDLRDLVQIQPATVRVRAPLERKVWTKTGVYVYPKLGQPAPGTVVASLNTRPLRVDVTGPDAVLAELWVLETETIELPPLPGRREWHARIVAPPGVTRVDPPRVRVAVEVDRGSRPPMEPGPDATPPEERP